MSSQNSQDYILYPKCKTMFISIKYSVIENVITFYFNTTPKLYPYLFYNDINK